MSEQAAEKPLFDTTVCPHCFNEVVHWLPAQPLFPLEMAAAALLIRKKGQMYTLFWRHKDILDPPRSARGPHGRRYRLLTAREIPGPAGSDTVDAGAGRALLLGPSVVRGLRER
jgi:hypothetical protein